MNTRQQTPLDRAARTAALGRYATAYDRFAEQEQLHRARGHVYTAEGAHVVGLRILRAWIAEEYDPVPEGLPA